jgi:hypothetical protein
MLDETPPGQQIDLPLGEVGAGLNSSDGSAATDRYPADEPGAMDVALALLDPPAVRPPRLPWASLLMRSLGVSGLECPQCQSQMVLLALITAPRVVAKILDHLRIPSTPPPLAPARPATEPFMFGDELDQTDPFDASDSAAPELTGGAVASRAPP